MILPSFKEDQVLKSLLDDQKGLKKEITKQVKKYQEYNRKRRHDIDDNILYVPYLSPSHNQWHSIIRFTKNGKASWYSMKYCVVESEYGNKDYYFLRGLSDNQPYFVKLSSHVVKRFLERGLKKGWDSELDFQYTKEAFISSIFRLHEIGLSIKNIPYEFLQLYRAADTEEDFEHSRVTYFNAGIFYGTKSQIGNYSFKTFVGVHEISEKYFDNKISNEFPDQAAKVLGLQRIHYHFNKHLWTEEEIGPIKKMLNAEDEIDEDYLLMGENGITLLKP